MKQFKLAENLVFLRRKRGVTQELIADFLGVTKASVSKWETGLSMPDITQLPKLASYYDVTIDELMGYEAQLSMEQIKKYYNNFADAFAKRPVNEVFEEVRDFIRQYYSCYEALLEMVVLLLNHYAMVEAERQSQLLEEMVRLCERVQEKSTDVSLCSSALELQAMIELVRGNSESVIEKLKFYQNPRNVQHGTEAILVQAYQMAGQMEAAEEWNQVLIWNHLLSLVGNSTTYLMMNLNEREVGRKTIERIDKLMELYEVDKLHPNTYLQFQYATALFYAIHGMNERAIETLQSFVKNAIDFIKNDLFLHGDAYFNRLDNYFKKYDEYLTTPRNAEVIIASIIENLNHPAFAGIQDTEEFKEMKRSVEQWNR